MVSLSSIVMASSVSCLDVSDSLTVSTPGVLTSNVTSVTSALAHSQVNCHHQGHKASFTMIGIPVQQLVPVQLVHASKVFTITRTSNHL